MARPKVVIPKSQFEEDAKNLREANAKHKMNRLQHESIVMLDPPVRVFCAKVAEGMSYTDAANFAGFANPAKAGKTLMQRPAVRKALGVMVERTLKLSEITREEVIAGFMDAIAISRQQSEAMGMIAGYREIGKMLGMYETKVKIEVTGSEGEIQRRLNSMSDAELIKVMNDRANLALPPIEGELAHSESHSLSSLSGDILADEDQE